MVDREEYALSQKILHWLIALLLLGMLIGGMVMTELGWDDPETAKLTNLFYSMHKSSGFLLLALMALRLLARLIYGAPLQDATLPGWQRLAAGGTHLALYALLVAMPLVGWAAISAGNYMEPVYGLFSVPKLEPAMVCGWIAPIESLIGTDGCGAFLAMSGRDQAEALFEAHEAIGMAIIAVAALHILAALYHGLIRQDGVMARMWFRKPSPERLG